MLATWADRAKAVCINEIDPVRAGLLRHLFPGISVTSFNAAQINQHVSVAPTVVIMNPPFARNAAGAVDPFAAHRHFAASSEARRDGKECVCTVRSRLSPYH